MIGFDEALALIQREVAVLPARTCAAPDAVGLVLASDVCSGEDLPPFDNSAMDGFALRIGSEPLAVGAELDVAGAQAAGDTHAIATSGAWEIMTGARLPDGLDAVIPVEQVEVLARDGADRPLRIRTTAVVEPGQHVRLRGEDVRTGACILKAGTRIEAPQLMLLAALGVAQVQVRPAPRVALLTTGR